MGLVGFTSPWEDSRNKFNCVNSKAEKWNGVAETLAFESATQQVTASSHPIFRRTACTCSRHQSMDMMLLGFLGLLVRELWSWPFQIESRSTRRPLCLWCRHHWTAASCRCLRKSVAWIWLLSPSSDLPIRSLCQLSAAHASVTVNIEPRETLHYRSSIWCCHTSCQPHCLESTCSSCSMRVKWCEIHTNGGRLCCEWMKYNWTTAIACELQHANHVLMYAAHWILQKRGMANTSIKQCRSMLNLAWQTCSVTSLNP